MKFQASTFTAGSPGQPLRLQVAHTGQRGIFIDNVLLTTGPTIPPGTVLTVR